MLIPISLSLIEYFRLTNENESFMLRKEAVTYVIVSRHCLIQHFCSVALFNWTINQRWTKGIHAQYGTQSKIFLWTFRDWGGQACESTHYRGPTDGICRVYWGKLPTMSPTIYSCLWWDNHTSSPNNVGTPHAFITQIISLNIPWK